MRFTRRFFGFSILCAILASVALGDVTERAVAPGVRLQQESISTASGSELANVLRIDLKKPGVRVQTGIAQDVILADDATQGREALGALASRHKVVAAVNADFFPFTGDPLGIAIRDGQLLSESMPHRVALGITRDGTALFDTLLAVGTLYTNDGMVVGLDGINRSPGKDELVLLTPAFGSRSRAAPGTVSVPLSDLEDVRIGQEYAACAGQAGLADPFQKIPEHGALLLGSGAAAEWLKYRIHTGDRLRLRFDLAANPLPPGPRRGDLPSRAGSLRGRISRSAWLDVEQAVGGGPWLVRDGAVSIDGPEEGFTDSGFVNNKHPRTAAGVAANGELILVTVDGRQGQSKGMSLGELAAYMIKLGAVQAINLDGGGSTSMVVRDLYVNSPSDGFPRPIADALLIYADDALQNLPQPTATVGESVNLKVGDRIQLRLPDGFGEVVWGTVEGRAFVNQRGVLHATRAGSGTVIARSGAAEVRFPYTIQGGQPATIKAEFSPLDNNPPDRNLLTVRLIDANGFPLLGQAITLKVSGGEAQQQTLMTDKMGRCSVEIVWNVEKDRTVTISWGGRVTIKATAK